MTSLKVYALMILTIPALCHGFLLFDRDPCNQGAISGYTVSSSSQSSNNPVTDVFKDSGWCAATDKINELVDIEFPDGFGAKGFTIGSTTVDGTSHPSSVLVQYVPIGASYLQNFPLANQQPLIILLNNTGTSTMTLGTGIAVQRLRFILLSFSGRACMKLKVTGCDVKGLCSPPCMNGGNCLAEDFCLCQDGFQGDRCETKPCNAAPLGIFDGRVPQKDITVSSEDPEYPKAQIGYDISSPTSNKGWCASDNDLAPWVQVKFDEPKAISTIHFYYINGPNQLHTFMRRFELQYIAPTDSARIFRTYTDGIDSLNGTHAISVTMVPQVITDTIRIVSQAVEKKACFKLEIRGCAPSGLCQAGFCQNGGSCISSNICKCPDGFFGNRCDQTKTDINTPTISFVNITQNMLVTTTFTFSVTGSVSIKQVNNTNVLIMNGANSNIKIDKGTPGAECLNNINNCQTGFTLSLDVNFGSLVDNTYIVSSGGDIAGHKGLALYYNQQSLTYIVTTANQIWSLTVHYVPVLNVWQKFEITWNTNLGIGLFLNGNLLGTHGRPEPTTATETAGLCIGCNPGQTSTVVINMQILQMHTWTVSRTELVNAGIVVAPVVTNRRHVQTTLSTAQPTSIKQSTAVPTVATKTNWNGLKATWGLNPFSSFNSLPRTRSAAVSAGWELMVPGQTGCTDNPNFLGFRYWKDNDMGIILIFDNAGYIAGIQAGVSKNYSPNPNNFPNPGVQKQPMVLDGDTYYVTAYFVNPATLCTGRTKSEFAAQGTGTGLWIQNGTNPITQSTQMPATQAEADKTMWTKGACFYTMGLHYWYDISLDMDCNNFYPVFLLYNKGYSTRSGGLSESILQLPSTLNTPHSLLTGTS